jgi:hypothetical protein
MNSPGSFNHRRYSQAVALFSCLTLGLTTSSLWAQCGEVSPAFPVPQFRNSVELWPDNFRPVLPGQQLEIIRDTTQYRSLTQPNQQSGHELFRGMDIAGNHLFAAYSNGISAWDIDPIFPANAEDPNRRAFRDGHQGHWMLHPPPGESDGVIWDLAAIQDPGNSDRIFIAVAAGPPVGVALWKFSKASGQFTEVYQHTGVEALQVQLTNFNGNVYAFATSESGPLVGVNVFDVTAAAGFATGCIVDSANGVNTCPGSPLILRGRVGNGAQISAASRYIGLVQRNGSIFIGNSFGGAFASLPFPEIWEVPNPASPSSSIRRFQGNTTVLTKATYPMTLFQKGANYYLAVVDNKRLRIYNVDDCLDASGCTGLPTPSFDRALRSNNINGYFLTFSESNGTPFLYQTPDNQLYSGSDWEGLWDLSNLGGSNNLTEITATGGTYTDTCGNTGIGYWADYYEKNEFGLRNFNARKGKFNGKYFYRATVATIDVHVRESVISNPAITTTVNSPAPYWFGVPIDFVATAQNCAGPETWTWFADDTNAIGLGANDNTATITWNLCPGTDCPDKTIEVWALKQACESAGNLQQDRELVTVAEPRPQVRSIAVTPTGTPPNTFPVCTALNFSADVDGRPAFTYAWTARNANGGLEASSGTAGFLWDTTGVNVLLPEIFSDGFETGNTSRWTGTANFGSVTESQKVVRQELVAPEQSDIEALIRGILPSAEFDVELVLTNPPNTAAQSSLIKTVTLTALGDLVFTGATPITATNLGNGSFSFVANSENATSWRWEIEDPANGTSSCTFTGAPTTSPCTVINFGSQDATIDYTWTSPNVSGNTYRIKSIIDNCTDDPQQTAQIGVVVTNIGTPVVSQITQFKASTTSLPGGCTLDIFATPYSRLNCSGAGPFNLTFTVAHSGNPSGYQFNWNRTESNGDTVFEDSRAVAATVNRNFGSNGCFIPQARTSTQTADPLDLACLPGVLPPNCNTNVPEMICINTP